MDNNLMIKEGLNNPENEPKTVKAAIKGCMDEHVITDDETIKFGVAGSGVVDENGGSPEGKKIYPPEDRKILAKANKHIDNGLTKVCEALHINLSTCSHPGCGAGNAQGFTTERLIEATKAMASKVIKFVGHLKISANPEKLDDSKASACITRKEEDHRHTAKYVRLTTGGGTTGEEQKDQQAFDVSADWIGADEKTEYSENERLTDEERVDVLVAQMKLAYMIAPDLRTNQDPFVIFDAGRIKDTKEVQENRRIAELAVEKALNAIKENKWQVPMHH